MDMDTSKFTNTDHKPTEVSDSPFLYCIDEEINKQYSHVRSWGKWMMFFPKTQLDEKWTETCRLYREKKLIGIAHMKVSTAYDSDRASDKSQGVIVFYCGPPDDRTNLMAYGRNLLEHITYETSFGFMYYKSDEQTNAGTRATGQKKNSLYRLPVSGGDDDEWDDWRYGRFRDWSNGSSDEESDEIDTSESVIAMDPACLNIESKPSEVTDHPFVFRCNTPDTAYRVDDWGKWLMFFPRKQLDEKWKWACDLYDYARLHGVEFMKVSTAYPSERASDTSKGVIAFYCGPPGNKFRNYDIGRDLVAQMEYACSTGRMYYKTESQSARGTRATRGSGRNSAYSIRVPTERGDGKDAATGPSAASTSSAGGGRRKKVKLEVKEETATE